MNYSTKYLPPQFIYLGFFLLGIGLWRSIVLDWFGLVLLSLSLFILFLNSGLLIDIKNKQIKEYISIFGIKRGKWLSISKATNLQIYKKLEAQTMNVASIQRSEVKQVYKLFLIFPTKKIELLSGDKEYIEKASLEISNGLGILVIPHIKN